MEGDGRQRRHIVLVGVMGVGKTTVGRRLAKELQRPFVDADEQLELRAGRTIPTIFRDDGEEAFRRLESEVLADLLGRSRPLVVAAGGGVVARPDNRQRLAREAFVVWLRASAEFLAGRTDPTHRPLLAGTADPLAALEGLIAARSPLYEASADVTVDVGPFHAGDDKPKRALARHIAGLVDHVFEDVRGSRPDVSSRTGLAVEVRAGGRTYPVIVGAGVRRRLPEVLAPGARRVAVVSQAGIGLDVDPGREHEVFTIGDGEPAKSLATVEDLCRAWSRWGLTRTDQVVAVGGGVVTDTAAFAAAVYHRGVAVAHVPTTLLGMVDAAIGGKSGVNLPEGKNLVGAFWQPTGVLCDTDALATLPESERRSGMGEMAKYHFLAGEDLLALPLAERIAVCIRIKADVVAADEREEPSARRGRATLNYGHTLAHALETSGGYDLRHGEAVAIGLAYAAELAAALGRIDRARVDEHRRVIVAYGLPCALPAGVDPAALVTLMARDKKAVDGLTFVLDGPAGVEVVPGVDPETARATLERMRTCGD